MLFRQFRAAASGESWCFLVAKPNDRLCALTRTNDGFLIAQKDLELRGPGELLGTRQHGVSLLPGGVELGNVRLLGEAAECAAVLASAPEYANAYGALRQCAAKLIQKTMRDVSVS